MSGRGTKGLLRGGGKGTEKLKKDIRFKEGRKGKKEKRVGGPPFFSLKIRR